MDFMLPYSKATIYPAMYMRLTKEIDTERVNGKSNVLKPINNLYRQKQDGKLCNKYLMNKILTVGFEILYIGRFIFYQGLSIFACYVDDGIFSSSFKHKIYQTTKYIQP